MNKSPNKIREWLNLNKDNLLKIKKEEDGDVDLAELKLEKVDLVEHKDYDNYLSAQALLLNGEGNITTDFGKVPLPYDVFEISLTDQWSVETTGNIMYLHTERGNYTIEAKNS